jgi:hypothetical protein
MPGLDPGIHVLEQYNKKDLDGRNKSGHDENVPGPCSMPVRDRALWALAILLSLALLIAPAVWNGFPLLQYDTGGYLAPWFDGRLHTNRSAPYGLLLVAGRWPDFWPVLIVQSVLTVWVLALSLRAHRLGGRPLLLLAIVAALCFLTTLPWLTAILLTDIIAGLGVLALYLLLLRDEALNARERIGLLLFVAFSAATHSATMAVLAGLVIVAAIVWLIDSARIPYRQLLCAIAALLLGALMTVTANALVVGRLTWAPGGYALSFGRMLQDGIVKRYLDDHCPDASLRLCPYKDQLPHNADDFFWGGGLFTKLGRFDGLRSEMRRIALDSLANYPALQIKSVLTETATQLTMVDTGAGVVKWVMDSYYSIKRYVPAALPGLQASRQEQTGIDFTDINRLQVPLAYLAMALLPLIAVIALRRKDFIDIGELAAACALALIVNAAIFGALATAHNRYGARMVWLAGFVVMLALARTITRNETPGLPR